MGESIHSKSSWVTTQKNILALVFRKIALWFSPPELFPIKTKSEESTVKLAMTKREIKKISKQICEHALNGAKK